MSELEDFIDEIPDLKNLTADSPEFVTWKKDLGILIGLISETGLVNIKRFWEIKFYPDSKSNQIESYNQGLDKSDIFLKDLFKIMKQENPDYKKISKKIEIEENVIEFFIRNWKFSLIIIFIFYAFTAYIIPYAFESVK
jgi:hypothetical protein